MPSDMTDAARTMETWATLHRAHARVLNDLSRRMEAERDVSVLEHGCLYELNSTPGRQLRMATVAERLGMSPSAATRLVDRLEERGWIRRASPPENRRTVNVAITADGRRAYVRNNRPFTVAVEDAIGARLTAQEMVRLISLLGRLGAGSNAPGSRAYSSRMVSSESRRRYRARSGPVPWRSPPTRGAHRPRLKGTT